MSWQPPVRPQWVDYLNRMGDAVGGAKAVVSINASELIDTARQITGLNNFGPGNWEQSLKVLVDAVNQEAQLHLTGLLMTRTELLRGLQNRLRTEEAIRLEPAILDQAIEQPVFICGLARSGTSITHELMAQDSRFHAPRCWEVFNSWPAPEPETCETDPRIALADAEHLFFEQVVPAYRAMHENGGALPIECIYITAQAFISILYVGCMNIPSYSRYLASTDNTPAFEYHKRVLQVLQSRMPGKRWMLKSPNHIDNLDPLFKVYPDAKIIHTHRDPSRSIPSTLSIMATTTSMRSDLQSQHWAKYLHKAMSMSLNNIIEQRSNGQLPDAQFVDLHYADLMGNPAGALGSVYQQLGMQMGPEGAARVRHYLDNKPRQKHGVHSYSMEDFSLDEEKIRASFEGYMEHYNIVSE